MDSDALVTVGNVRHTVRTVDRWRSRCSARVSRSAAGSDPAMALNRTSINAPPAAVFAILRDGYSYDQWVVGTKKIRDVEPNWPAVGSRLHHTFGAGPLTISDTSKVLAVDPDRMLEMEARAWPAGTARIVLSLEPAGSGTRVTIEEHPLRGPGRRLHNPAFDLIIKVRNVETLRRLKRLAEQRGAAD